MTRAGFIDRLERVQRSLAPIKLPTAYVVRLGALRLKAHHAVLKRIEMEVAAFGQPGLQAGGEVLIVRVKVSQCSVGAQFFPMRRQRTVAAEAVG